MFPEARQCRIEGHQFEGAVAVKSEYEYEPGSPMWGIFHPTSSGRWGTDDDVWDWTVMVPAEQPDDEPVTESEEGE